ncbi:MAG TPA: hypothetical protein ENO09_02620 [bacterium]|nr:hypothetical protein [bacterium]
MYAERLMLETDAQGRLRSLPRLPPNRRFEAIFLVEDEESTGAESETLKSDALVLGRAKDALALLSSPRFVKRPPADANEVSRRIDALRSDWDGV